MIRNKVLGILKLVEEGKAPDDNRLTFINDSDRLMRQKVHEYNLWYEGDGDELLNYYTSQNTIEYNYEPWYSRNKRSYYWAISTTETDIKRTHSGMARNIVDTLVSIMPFPRLRAGKLEDDNNGVNKNLEKILRACKLKNIYKQQQMPLTLVEGWGCYKINFDPDFSEYPSVVYYRAENVDFIYKYGQIIGIIFRDYYTNGKRRFMSVETRYFKVENCKKKLIIETELYEVNLSDSNYIQRVDLSNVPQLAGIESVIEGENIPMLFAVPCIFFEDSSNSGAYGRSIFCGKVDLLDDLDQCLSQKANCIRKSTPIEYFNNDFLERDRNGLPKQPHCYDRKYIMYKGQRTADGSAMSNAPVVVTQPQLNLEQYDMAATNILLELVEGIMSPATLGIDIAKKDNAEAQREKEKVTIFTRNAILDIESEILRSLCSQLLCAYEYMQSQKVSVKEYEVAVKFDRFADDSYESKLEKLSAAFDSETLSEEMFMEMLYDDTLSQAEYQRELKWLKDHHTKPRDDGMQGMAGGGENAPGMLGNMMGFGTDEDEESSI